MNIATLLARSARVFPDAPALLRGRSLLADYRAFARRAAALAATMRARHGLVPGDRVALFMTNHPACLEVLFGAWMAGLVAVPINCKLHPAEARYILENSGTALLFVTADLIGAMASATTGLADLREVIVADSAGYEALVAGGEAPLVHRAADDVAWLFYTSGTTGRPKGVMITHRNLLAMSLAHFADVDPAERADAVLYAAPMTHGAGLYGLPNVLCAARHVVPESGGFDAAEFLALAHHHGRVSAFAAPTMVKRLVDHAASAGADGEGLRTLVYGGGPMYAADIRRALDVLGQRFVQIYGQGESPMTITVLGRAHLADAGHPRHAERIASVGVAQSVVEVRVADEEGRSLPAGAVGEVLVRGETVMKGYWDDPAATARALRDGWLWTGDVGVFDDDGFLTLIDRSKDLIISGGSNIYPREVEEVLLAHPSVHEASVVGRQDPEWGETVVAFVVVRPGAAVDPGELDRLCLARIARFKRPKEYLFVTELPKNNYGKVLKTVLRERLAPAAPAA